MTVPNLKRHGRSFPNWAYPTLSTNPRTREGETLNEQTHDELLALGGEDQIPFLVDHQREETMYESDDIAEYLKSTTRKESDARSDRRS